MLSKVITGSVLTLLSCSLLNAAPYDAQAQKDRAAMIKYMQAKFKSIKTAKEFFPYTPESELKNNFIWDFPFQDFGLGNAGYVKSVKAQFENFMMLPPFYDAIDKGKKLYHEKFTNGNSFATCFPDPAIVNLYPKFDDKTDRVVTLSQAIDNCLTKNGESPWKLTGMKMAYLESYLANKTTEAGKKFDIKIQSAAAAQAYRRGKIEFYSQRGYLDLSCATCHVAGAGMRTKADYHSPLLGMVAGFPVYRLKWGHVGTLEKRLVGCNKNQGEVPHKPNSRWMADLEYFITYMSNGIKVSAPSVRK